MLKRVKVIFMDHLQANVPFGNKELKNHLILIHVDLRKNKDSCFN